MAKVARSILTIQEPLYKKKAAMERTEIGLAAWTLKGGEVAAVAGRLLLDKDLRTMPRVAADSTRRAT